MPDATVDRLATYAANLRYDDLPPEVVHQTKRVLLDALGCGLGAFTSEPARIARELGLSIRGDVEATLLGTRSRTTPYLAAFANGIMVRYLDFNDTAIGGHGSDNFAGVLATAEAYGASGRDLITGCVLAYEVQAAWGRTFELRGGVWDQAVYAATSVPLGAGKVMGLDRSGLAEALRMSVVGSMALNETRRGSLSHWKSAAVPNAGRNAVFAAMLASRGFTGPDAIFEGTQGFFAGITGGPVKLRPLAGEDGTSQRFLIQESRLKRFPSGSLAQTAIEGALEARRELALTTGDMVQEVHILTTEQAIASMAGHASRWRPETRETADHSLPYAIACALEFGSVEPGHFSQELLASPQLIALMQRIRVDTDADCQSAWPEANPSVVTVTRRDGQKHTAAVRYHLGHARRPMDDSEIEAKFRGLTRGLLTESQQKAALDALWHVEETADLRDLMGLLVVDPSVQGRP